MKPKQKICFLLSKFAKGGGERVVSILSDELTKYYDVDVILLQSKSESDYKTSANIIEINKRKYTNNYGLLVHSVIGLKKYIRENNPKAIISFMELPNLVNMLVNGNHKRIVSVRNHMSAKWKDKRNIRNWSIRCMYKKADSIVSPTQLIADDLIKNYKIEKKKIKLISNPYKIDAIRKNFVRKVSTEYTITTMGSLVKAKGVFNLLKSYIMFCNAHPEIASKLVFIGKGVEEENLRRMASEAGIDEKVVFKGFMLNPHEEVAKSNLYVLSSFYEGFPNALVEAMICQVPVIATNCPSGPSEILSDTELKNIDGITMCDYGYLMPVFDKNVEEKERNLAKFFYDFYMTPEREKKYMIEKATSKTLTFEASKVAKEWRELIEVL